MSIKIAGTVVINNDRELKEITGNVGRIKTNNSGYGISSTTDNINFSTPMMNCILGGDTTFTETSVMPLLVRDLTSESLHTPRCVADRRPGSHVTEDRRPLSTVCGAWCGGLIRHPCT